MKNDLLVGLDIGTTKICALIAKVKKEGNFEILGMGRAPSRGLEKGIINDIKKTSQMIRRALKRAELNTGLKTKQSWVSIAGDHIQGRDNRGFTKIEGEDRVVTTREVEKALKDASDFPLPPDREIIHILPQEFAIDEQGQIKEVIGMSGRRLEAKAHVITASSSCKQNIENSVREGGHEPEGMVLQSLASGIATLYPEEEDLGVTLLDMGGGTTDIAIFLKEGIRFTRVLGIGGNHITNDIAVGFHTSPARAEEIKIKYGSASMDLVEGEKIEVERVAGRGTYRVSRRDLTRIIQMRVEEIFELIEQELKKSGYKDLMIAGAVLTGGCSLLKGIKEKAEEKLNLPVRIGYPLIEEPKRLKNPIYATAVGLLLYGVKRREELASRSRLLRIKEWFEEFL